MLTRTQKKLAIFISTIAAAVFSGLQLFPSFAAMFKTDPTPTTINTANAPGGIAIAGGTISALPSKEGAASPITIYNYDPKTLDYLKQEIIGHELQKQAAHDLETRLSESAQSAEKWKFWYFRDVHPLSIKMLQDLAALQNFVVRREVFDARWADLIPSQETRSIYLNNILVQQGWAIEQAGLLSISTNGLAALKQAGLDSIPYKLGRGISPSFNCNKADKWFEKLICSDDDLAKLDVEMARLFRQLQNQSSRTQLAAISQADWRNKVRNICPDRSCLIASYTGRIAQLKAMGAQ